MQPPRPRARRHRRPAGREPGHRVNVRRRYRQQGLAAALTEKPRSGQPRKVTAAVEATITSLACTDAPHGASRWSIRLLRGRLIELGVAVGEESVRQVLKKASSNPG
ncbi:hypothetical protein CDA63_18395 [Hymenobacter amundsenii]|uniref:Helix-turn-helix domain-containing protein n=1 Tax=Hymenobacter amundsenii TaxID=2006685 RepID=A0A246FGH5_9BACT|nr:hypothetical protein CDA63_18395 [Hymenobacter amundsenii]